MMSVSVEPAQAENTIGIKGDFWSHTYYSTVCANNSGYVGNRALRNHRDLDPETGVVPKAAS